jgi:hypothetical protein
MADIQLSPELFSDIQQAVSKQHPDADNGVVLQYLAAVSGYLLGNEPNMQKEDKDRYLDDLFGFAGKVCSDVHGHVEQQAQAAQPAPPVGQAFGYWVPPKG